ncbi:MAG: hypothetical protein ACO3KE_08485, partial [Ilumatobacteraceae bacterium]
DELVGPWKTMSSIAAEHYGALAVEQPGLELVWRHFERLARDTVDLLSSVGGRAMSSDDDEEIVVRISGAGARNALDSLRSQGFAAEVVDGE